MQQLIDTHSAGQKSNYHLPGGRVLLTQDQRHLFVRENLAFRRYIYTYQTDASTIKRDTPEYANNYDHFSFDERTRRIVRMDSIHSIDLVNKYTVDVCHLQQFTDLCSTGFFFRASILSGNIFYSILMLLFYTSPEVYTIIGMVSNSNKVDSSAMTIIQLHPVL